MSEISQKDCRDIRERFREASNLKPLVDEFDVDRSTLRYHLYGDCTHDPELAVDSESVITTKIDEEECIKMRTLFAEGRTAEEISDEVNHTWRTVVRHLIGDCRHEASAATYSKQEVYDRFPVSVEDCKRLRSKFHENEEEDVLDIANDERWTYQTILRHINGHCEHVDVGIEPREVESRSSISEEKCAEMREEYHSSAEVTYSEIAQEYDISRGSVEKHLRYHCTHEGESELLNSVDIDFDDMTEGDKASSSVVETQEDVSEYTDIENIDTVEYVSDIPETQRKETTTSRVIRNTQLVKDLKQEHSYQCQLCGGRRYRSKDEYYAEGHHIKPLGDPHEGPDIRENILVLCPNHHADFDYGIVKVNPETLEVEHLNDEEVNGNVLDVSANHQIGEQFLEYHNQNIAEF